MAGEGRESLHPDLDPTGPGSRLQRLLGHILSVLGRQTRAQGAALWCRNAVNAASAFHLSFENGELWPRTGADRSAMGKGANCRIEMFGQEVLRTNKAVVCEDVETDPRVGTSREGLIARGIRSVLVVPLLAEGQVIGGIGIWHSRKRKYRSRQIELVQELARQAALEIEVMHLAEQSRELAVLEERNRLARDIHDTLAQSFTGIIVQLEAAEDASRHSETIEAGNHLRRAAKLARMGLTEARRSLQALRSAALEGGTFLEALERLFKEMTPGSAVQIELNLAGTPRPLSPDLEESLLRIAQEALTNTLRHARAARFEVGLIFGPGEVRLEIRDDGCGFVKTQVNAGLGLIGMKERVARIAGRLNIQSAPGQGTMLVVTLPDVEQTEAI